MPNVYYGCAGLWGTQNPTWEETTRGDSCSSCHHWPHREPCSQWGSGVTEPTTTAHLWAASRGLSLSSLCCVDVSLVDAGHMCSSQGSGKMIGRDLCGRRHYNSSPFQTVSVSGDAVDSSFYIYNIMEKDSIISLQKEISGFGLYHCTQPMSPFLCSVSVVYELLHSVMYEFLSSVVYGSTLHNLFWSENVHCNYKAEKHLSWDENLERKVWGIF